jgi:probable rRNA maturation factor
MMIELDIQKACQAPIPVSDDKLEQWVKLALTPHQEQAELTLRLVDTDEIQTLNKTYRKQDKATNVLAFPSDIPKEILLECPLLGDVIICPTVLEEESVRLEIPLTAHWAHIVIHGVLHLLGYDHIEDYDAEIMQALEIETLTKLGFDNPYHEDNLLD